ncbi:uncharacterized protein LOC125422020 [Ziziphus jujuba]|uniref:Uncharacterized protein LOC125422020 n=1 Tax=Ziziphus jujuba TaxID=326968 RepID=A0ABM3IHG1_ZIZJJ|nr:uncharacterized protein LOC125422020 [Ziziphus jujuba]
MVIRESGEIEFEEAESDNGSMPPLEDVGDEDEDDYKYPVCGDLSLVVKRALTMYKDEKEVQQDNIFHTRCKVTDKQFDDVFPKEIPSGLPLIIGIEHQIDFVPRSTILNWPAYRSNPEKTKKLQRQFVVVYFDDILVYSRGLEEHVGDLRLVLDVFRKEKLYANLKNYDFCKSELMFLGFVISAAGITVDQEKVKAIREWFMPTSITQV